MVDKNTFSKRPVTLSSETFINLILKAINKCLGYNLELSKKLRICPKCHGEVITSVDKLDWFRCNTCMVYFGYDSKKHKLFKVINNKPCVVD